MANRRFSERNGFAPQPNTKPDDYLPGWVRESITNEIRSLVSNKPQASLPDIDIYTLFRPYIWQVLGREPPGNPMNGPWAMYIPKTLLQCSWWQFYDMLQQISEYINQQWGEECSVAFSGRLNIVLAREGIPWKIEDNEVIRALAPQVQEQISKASALLTNPKFEGPDEQFNKAILCLNRRPEPDEENCVKDAVGALEAVANIIAGTTGIQLNTLLNRELFRSNVDIIIRQTIEKIYAYRGAAPGVGHALIGHSTVGITEATWVLATSAATILYLVAKFP
jgi:hypothetical protein